MDVRKLQTTLGVKADGQFGPISREALRSRFTNINAPAVNSADMTAFASRLGCSPPSRTKVLITSY